ncbi:MAG TPA: hypothetical protein VIU62_16885 [Chloroflexota bacterium]
MDSENTRKRVPERAARKRGDGEGSIDEVREGLWRGRLMVGYKADGKADRCVLRGKRRGEVQKKLAELRQRAEQGTLTEQAIDRLTVAGCFTRWSAAAAATVRPTTWRSDADLIRLHVPAR